MMMIATEGCQVETVTGAIQPAIPGAVNVEAVNNLGVNSGRTKKFCG
jgi:hypothetical protein